MRHTLLLAALLASPACFSPSPSQGLPCSPDGSCPDGQECDLSTNTCLSDAPECAAGETLCSAQCVDLASDSAFCGDCDTACDSATQECQGGACVPRCDLSLDAPVTDRWGNHWDGADRTASDLATASSACEGIGGRLPTATELHRASQRNNGVFMDSASPALLWTLAPHDQDEQVVMSAIDGVAMSAAVVAEQEYRCICPGPEPLGFTGENCLGPLDSECISLVSGYRIDARPRPALRKNSAIWECAFDNGQLPTINAIYEAIENGVSGDNQFLWLSDQSGEIDFDIDAGVERIETVSATAIWNGDESATFVARPGFVQSGYAWSSGLVSRVFRCVGWPELEQNFPQTVANVFEGRRYQIDAADRASGTWPQISDVCMVDGGHVAGSDELAALVLEGLPGGSGGPVFTSDQSGLDGVDFSLTTQSWSAVDERHSLEYPNSQNSAHKSSASLPYRCIYYPMRTGFVAPANCEGGCTQIPVGGAGLRMWFDSSDRAFASFHDAQATCRANGGQLANERDITEGVRAGLPNGSFTYMWLADHSVGNSSLANQVQLARWQGSEAGPRALPGDALAGINRDHSDQWNVDGGMSVSTWSSFLNASELPELRPYRCMWTNELR